MEELALEQTQPPENKILTILEYFKGEISNLNGIVDNYAKLMRFCNAPAQLIGMFVRKFKELLENHSNGTFHGTIIEGDPQVHIITMYVESIFMSIQSHGKTRTQAGKLYKQLKSTNTHTHLKRRMLRFKS